MSERKVHEFLLEDTQLEKCIKFPENQNVTGSNDRGMLHSFCNVQCKTADQIFNVDCKCEHFDFDGTFISFDKRSKKKKDTSEMEKRAKDANTTETLIDCISGKNNDLKSLTTWSRVKDGDKNLNRYRYFQTTKYDETNSKKLITKNQNNENTGNLVQENSVIGSGDYPNVLSGELNVEHHQNHEYTSEKIESSSSNIILSIGTGVLAISLFAVGIMIYKKIIKRKYENDEDPLLE